MDTSYLASTVQAGGGVMGWGIFFTCIGALGSVADYMPQFLTKVHASSGEHFQ